MDGADAGNTFDTHTAYAAWLHVSNDGTTLRMSKNGLQDKSTKTASAAGT